MTSLIIMAYNWFVIHRRLLTDLRTRTSPTSIWRSSRKPTRSRSYVSRKRNPDSTQTLRRWSTQEKPNYQGKLKFGTANISSLAETCIAFYVTTLTSTWWMLFPTKDNCLSNNSQYSQLKASEFIFMVVILGCLYVPLPWSCYLKNRSTDFP